MLQEDFPAAYGEVYHVCLLSRIMRKGKNHNSKTLIWTVQKQVIVPQLSYSVLLLHFTTLRLSLSFFAWTRCLPSVAPHHVSPYPAFLFSVFCCFFCSWTGCPSSLCHFALFLPLPHSTPDLVQTADRRFCRCGSSLVCFFFSLSVFNLWRVRVHTDTSCTALSPLYSPNCSS